MSVYKYVTLLGVITAHEVVDRRWRITKWLDSKLPASASHFLGFQAELHYVVQVHLDDEAYAAAKGRLEIEHPDHDPQRIPNDKGYEVQKEMLADQYAVGKRVTITYCTSSALDQFFIGSSAFGWELKPLESKEKFLELPGAIMPGQHDFFFA